MVGIGAAAYTAMPRREIESVGGYIGMVADDIAGAIEDAGLSVQNEIFGR